MLCPGQWYCQLFLRPVAADGLTVSAAQLVAGGIRQVAVHVDAQTDGIGIIGWTCGIAEHVLVDGGIFGAAVEYMWVVVLPHDA